MEMEMNYCYEDLILLRDVQGESVDSFDDKCKKLDAIISKYQTQLNQTRNTIITTLEMIQNKHSLMLLSIGNQTNNISTPQYGQLKEFIFNQYKQHIQFVNRKYAQISTNLNQSYQRVNSFLFDWNDGEGQFIDSMHSKYDQIDIDKLRKQYIQRELSKLQSISSVYEADESKEMLDENQELRFPSLSQTFNQLDIEIESKGDNENININQIENINRNKKKNRKISIVDLFFCRNEHENENTNENENDFQIENKVCESNNQVLFSCSNSSKNSTNDDNPTIMIKKTVKKNVLKKKINSNKKNAKVGVAKSKETISNEKDSDLVLQKKSNVESEVKQTSSRPSTRRRTKPKTKSKSKKKTLKKRSNKQSKNKSKQIDYNYYCGKCNKGYILERHFKKHMMTHSVSKDNKSKEKLKSNLKMKMIKSKTNSIKDNIGFPCDLCGQRLSTKKQLKNHKLGHANNEKAFKCHLCSKRFAEKKVFESHVSACGISS